MPPKAGAAARQAGNNAAATAAGEKPKKVTALQLAVDGAAADARRLYKQHEQQRLRAEAADLAAATRQELLATVAAVRVREEAAAMAALRATLHESEALALREHAKHEQWRRVPHASRLPDVDHESAINTFLRIWREREDAVVAATRPETAVTALARTRSSFVATSTTQQQQQQQQPSAYSGVGGGGSGSAKKARVLHFMRGEQGMPATRRRQFVDEELQQCVEACALARALQSAHDTAVAERRRDAAARYARSLCDVYAHVLHSLDVVTVYALLYYDVMLDSDGDGEMLMRCVAALSGERGSSGGDDDGGDVVVDGYGADTSAQLQPQPQPTLLKYGLWVKVKEMTRSFTSLVFGALDVRLDPKQPSLPKLPRALGLSKENVAVRVLQMAFDPYAGYTAARIGRGARNGSGEENNDDDDDDDDDGDGDGGGEYYALECTLKVDLLSFSDRPRRAGEWRMRAYTDAALALHTESYPPHNTDGSVGGGGGSSGGGGVVVVDDPAFRITFDLPTTIVLRQSTMLMGKWLSDTREWEPCSHTTIETVMVHSNSNSNNSNRACTATGGGVASASTRPRSQQQQQHSSGGEKSGNGYDAAAAASSSPLHVGGKSNNNDNNKSHTAADEVEGDARAAAAAATNDDVAGDGGAAMVTGAATAPAVGGGQTMTTVRRATFVTSELAHFAVLQERVYDAPYEAWSLRPLSDDTVLFTLEGKARGDAGDREFRVLVRDAACRLLAPDDAELDALRERWQSPTALFCALARAGFNFLLRDADARYLPGVTPRSAALEARAYADVAQFCAHFVIASSRHNQYVEDADMALFRVSRQMRASDDDDDGGGGGHHVHRHVVPGTYVYSNTGSNRNGRGGNVNNTSVTAASPSTLLDASEWLSVRYRRDSCALCACSEADEVAQLHVLEGHEPHDDLYATLLPLYGDDVLTTQLLQTNYLLRRCVHQILTLVRPLSWG